jgi:ankyrin repeat protein
MAKITFPGKASDFLKIGVVAAARGDLEAVRDILKQRPQWITRVGSHGRTMLWEASHRGKLEMVKYLVRRGADINACGTHYTPYFVEISCYCIARHKKHDDVADFLLEKGAKVDIHTAAFLGDREGVAKFLKRRPKSLNEGHPQSDMGDMKEDGLDFYLAPAPWATPLCYALRGADTETVEYLIEQGAKIKGNEEALFIAAKKNCDMLRLLLENGADPRKLPPVFPDEGELFELVASFGVVPPEAADSRELVYLCRGDRGGNLAEVKRLLDLGANVNFQDHKGKTALHRAARSGFAETMRILLDHGASVEIEDPDGETPLFDAVRSTIKNVEKKKEAVRILLESGGDPLHTNQKGETPLAVAEKARSPDAKVLAKMLRQGR